MAACGSAQKPVAEPVRVTSARAPVTKKAAEPTAATADTCDGIRECASIGLTLARAREHDKAVLALGKACTGTVRSIDACAVLAAMLEADGADVNRLADVAHNGCNIYGADDGERAARGAACAKWGAMLRDGQGTAADSDRAMRAFDDGCKLGSEKACAAKRELDAELSRHTEPKDTMASSGGGVPDPNLTIGRVTTNGVTVEDISCRADGSVAAAFGSIAIGKPFAEKKKALDACVKGKSHKARVRWTTSSSGRMSEVKVISGDDPSNHCIEKALRGAKTPVPGTCAASVDLGR
jgi:hypothetical protein